MTPDLPTLARLSVLILCLLAGCSSKPKEDCVYIKVGDGPGYDGLAPGQAMDINGVHVLRCQRAGPDSSPAIVITPQGKDWKPMSEAEKRAVWKRLEELDDRERRLVEWWKQNHCPEPEQLQILPVNTVRHHP